MKASIDRSALLQAIEGFTARHRHALYALVRRNSQLLEVATLMSCVQHYEHSGYAVSAVNTDPAGTFVFKSATTGDPRKYSWFAVATHSGLCYEIHANLPVKSAYGLDGGVYVVDVGVVIADAAVTKVRSRQWVVESLSVLTFAEVKALPVYPMLLAHFVGIVHEVKPQFLTGRVPYGFRRDRHLRPTLFSTRGLFGTSRNIVAAYAVRGFRIGMIADLDIRISQGGLDKLDRSICE